MNRKLVLAGSVFLAAAGIAALWGAQDDASAATTTVNVADDQFVSANITIAAGDTVTWDWTGSHQHTVTFEDASILNTGIQSQAFSASHQFNSPGTFAYYCQVHGSPGSGMSGAIVVQAAAAATGTATTAATSTNTPAATRTPGAATPTAAASTATSTAPAAAATATPPAIETLPAAASPAAGAASQLPRTGGGPGAGGDAIPAMVLAAAGAALLMAGVATKMRV